VTNSIYKISLDVNDHASRVSVKAKKDDTGRLLHISLMDGRNPYVISKECRAFFTAKKADGFTINNACSIIGNAVCYEFTPQTTSAVGKAECEIRLIGANDKLLTSARFALFVEDTVYHEGDDVESKDEATALTKLVSDATTLISEVEEKLDNGDFVGEPGYTPVRGKDYWTEDDKDEIINDLGKTNFDSLSTGKLVVRNAEDQDAGVTMECHDDGVLFLDGADFGHEVILRNVAPGEEDGDAVNYAQMRDYVSENVGGGTGGGASVEDVIEELTSQDLDMQGNQLENVGGLMLKSVDDKGAIILPVGYEDHPNHGAGVPVLEFYGTYGDEPTVLRNIAPGKQYYDAVTKKQLDDAIAGVSGGGTGGGATVELDTTLTQEGKAADAKAVGDRFNRLANYSEISDLYVPNSLQTDGDADIDFRGSVIRGVEPAEDDTDAVNLGQMKEYVAENAGGGGSSGVVAFDFDMDDLRLRGCSTQDIITHIDNGYAVQLRSTNSYGETRYYNLVLRMQDDLTFSHTDHYYIDTVTVSQDDSVEYHRHLSASKDSLGDIESALDGIIAMQNSLIGGEV
jgi:hypothetical protein